LAEKFQKSDLEFDQKETLFGFLDKVYDLKAARLGSKRLYYSSHRLSLHVARFGFANGLKTKHEADYLIKYEELKRRGNTSLDNFVLIHPKITHVIQWMDWILEGNLPFEFVSWPSTKRNSKLLEITPKYLKTSMFTIRNELVCEIKDNILPPNFGLMFDGWTDSNIQEFMLWFLIFLQFYFLFHLFWTSKILKRSHIMMLGM
jgi:hypothetical protein